MPGRARAAGLLMMVPAFYSLFVLFSAMDRTGYNSSLSNEVRDWARSTFGFWQSGLDGQERAFYALTAAVLALALLLGLLTLLRGALVICVLFLIVEALLAVPSLIWNVTDGSGWRKFPSWFVHIRAVPFHYGSASAWLLFVAAVVGLVLAIGARRQTGAGEIQQLAYQPYQPYQEPTALHPVGPEQPTPYPVQPVYQTEPATPAPAIAAAGWYPDPYGQTAQRYWDGSGWTEHTQG